MWVRRQAYVSVSERGGPGEWGKNVVPKDIHSHSIFLKTMLAIENASAQIGLLLLGPGHFSKKFPLFTIVNHAV